MTEHSKQEKAQKPQPPPPDTKRDSQDGPMGDSALTEEAAKDKDVDRSKTPGRAYDV